MSTEFIRSCAIEKRRFTVTSLRSCRLVEEMHRPSSTAKSHQFVIRIIEKIFLYITALACTH